MVYNVSERPIPGMLPLNKKWYFFANEKQGADVLFDLGRAHVCGASASFHPDKSTEERARKCFSAPLT